MSDPIKVGIVSEEQSEWDSLSLDRKLQQLAWEIDNVRLDAKLMRNLGRVSERLEELSRYVFKYQARTGRVL